MLAIDASHWQQQLDIPLLKKEGVDLAIIKASQGQLKDVAFTKHAKAVQDGGMMLATYIWVDPIIPTDLHVSNYESVIKGFSPQFVALDLEQWWNSWERWQKWRAKLIPQMDVPVIPGYRLSIHAKELYEKLKARGHKVCIYSSKGYIDGYMLGASWIKGIPNWVAWYPSFKTSITTWAQMRDHVASEPFQKFVKKHPVTPAVISQEDLLAWQFTGDKYRLPGYYGIPGKLSAIDLNWVYEDKLRQFIGAPPPVQPPVIVTPENKLQKLWDAHPELH